MTNTATRAGVHASGLLFLNFFLNIHRVLATLTGEPGNTSTLSVFAHASVSARIVLTLDEFLASISCKSSITYASSASFVTETGIITIVLTRLLHDTITFRSRESLMAKALSLSANAMAAIFWADLARLGELRAVVSAESAETAADTIQTESSVAASHGTRIFDFAILTFPRSKTLTLSQRRHAVSVAVYLGPLRTGIARPSSIAHTDVLHTLTVSGTVATAALNFDVTLRAAPILITSATAEIAKTVLALFLAVRQKLSERRHDFFTVLSGVSYFTRTSRSDTNTST